MNSIEVVYVLVGEVVFVLSRFKKMTSTLTRLRSAAYQIDAIVALCSGPKEAGQIRKRPLLWKFGFGVVGTS
jgi:hypothetical protein